MITESHKQILLVAPDDARTQWLREEVLQKGWRARVTCISNHTDVATRIDEQVNGRSFHAMIVPARVGRVLAITLARKYSDRLAVVLLDDPGSARDSASPLFRTRIVVPAAPSGPPELELIRSMESVLDRMPMPLRRISNFGGIESVLQSQIRWIDPQGELQTGRDILEELASRLLPENVDAFQLDKLNQGFSGSRVFRISYADSSMPDERTIRVLKLTQTAPHQSWKCVNEVSKFGAIWGMISDGKPVQVNISVFGDRRANQDAPEPARFGDWLGVMYSFVGDNRLTGGGRLEVADLECIVRNPRKQVKRMHSCGGKSRKPTELARDAIQLVMHLLHGWYQQGSTIVHQPLWATEEGRSDREPEHPPYSLRAWEKTQVIRGVESLAEYGVSLCGDDPKDTEKDWERGYRAVWAVLRPEESSSPFMEFLTEKHPVLVCPVHGDLNASNVMIALNYWMPVLIDFACYQEQGHALQDFARLETAIKLELMGRETGSPSGLDLNCSQFRAWCDAERALILGQDDAKSNKHVRPAFDLCRFIRDEAKVVHDSLIPSVERASDSHPGLPNFEVGYLAALLYHTLRAIGYDTLPHTKRILAVYSVGRIAERLDQIATS